MGHYHVRNAVTGVPVGAYSLINAFGSRLGNVFGASHLCCLAPADSSLERLTEHLLVSVIAVFSLLMTDCFEV